MCPTVCAKYEGFLYKTAEQYKHRIIKEDVGRKHQTSLTIHYGKSGKVKQLSLKLYLMLSGSQKLITTGMTIVVTKTL